MTNIKKTPPIILASASPRRREILEKTGLPFRVVTSNYDEDDHKIADPRACARLLSRKKAESVAEAYRDALVIGADTLIFFKNAIVGKPRDRRDAARMLAMLSGATHTVITGCTIIDGRNGKRLSRSEATEVTLKKMTKGEIARYIDTGEPLDKAGAYGIQGTGAAFVTRIAGDYFNVMGLPYSSLVESLKRFGIKLL